MAAKKWKVDYLVGDESGRVYTPVPPARKGGTQGETLILRQVREALVASGKCLIWRNSTGFDKRTNVRYGLGLGSADLVGIVKGKGTFLGVEIKTDKGKLSPEQVAWGEVVINAGARYWVVRSVEELMPLLETL